MKHGIVGRNFLKSICLAVLVSLIALVLLPGSYQYCFMRATGSTFWAICETQKLDFDHASPDVQMHVRQAAIYNGHRCALLIIMGTHIAWTLLLLFVIGLLTPNVSSAMRRLFRMGFLVVWFGGLSALAWGDFRMRIDHTLAVSFWTAFFVYLFVSVVFGSLLGVGLFVSRRVRRRILS